METLMAKGKKIDTANDDMMDALSRAGVLACAKSPLYTEGHNRQSANVSERLQQRRAATEKFQELQHLK
eukprot:4403403-Pyramimonas_sp.AAC.2